MTTATQTAKGAAPSAMVRDLAMQNLTDIEGERIRDRSARLVERRLLLRLVQPLNEEKRKNLIEILSGGSQKDLTIFVKKEAPKFMDWVVEETTKVRDELKGLG